MASRTLVIAPHPDDEILGCGGTLLRRRAEDVELAWLIVTSISENAGWPAEQVERRNTEISQVASLMGFRHIFNLGLPAAHLDEVPMHDLVEQFSTVFKAVQPEEVFVPHYSDVHTDHRVVFEAAAACTKWFRYPSVRRVLAYETISETEFGLNADLCFQPNYFVDVSDYLERKLSLMSLYSSELGIFPFPRSIEAIRALAAVRGAASGFISAEAFQLIRERH
jgi:N-acetylglucosamine malate deacetylase 1